MNRAVVYARLSDVRKGDTEGIERQLREAQTHADKLGVEVVEQLVDNDLSAAKSKRRPAFDRLMEGIRLNAWDVVILRSLDRWVRRPRELEDIIDLVEHSTVRVEAIHGVVELRTPQGRLHARLLTSVAMHEVETVEQRTRDWHADRAARGLPHVGAPGFGYLPDKVTVNEVEAEMIRDAAQRVLLGESLASIARDWTSRTERKWRANGVRRILMSPRTAGLRTHHGHITGEGVWPPILDRETWEHVGSLLRRPDRRVAPSNRDARLLTGIASCGVCRKTLNSKVVHGDRRYFCRHCHGVTVFAARLEGHVVERLCAWVDRGVVPESTEDRSRVLDAIAAAEADRDLLAAAVGAGGMTVGEWKIARGEIEVRLTELRRKLETDERTQLTKSWGAGKLSDKWETLPSSHQRRIVAAWIADIRVDPAVRGLNRFDSRRVHLAWRA